MVPKKCFSVLDLSHSKENQSASKVRPVTAEIEAGRRLNVNQHRLSLKKELDCDRIKPLYERPKTRSNTRRLSKYEKGIPILWKIEYPKDPKPKKCHHYDNLIIDRQILTRKEHINILSKPRKNFTTKDTKQLPKIVPRSIPPMTNRMNQLARPKKRDVIITWQKYASVLNGKQIDKFQGLVSSYQVMNNKMATEYLKQCRRDEKVRRKYQRQEAKRLRKEIEIIQLEEIKEVILRVFNEVHDYLCEHDDTQSDKETSGIKGKIHKLLCKYLKCKITKDSTKKERARQIVIKKLADRVSKWAEAFLAAAHYENEEGHRDFKEEETNKDGFGGYPIDDFILANEESVLDEEDLSCGEVVYGEDFELKHDSTDDKESIEELQKHDPDTVLLIDSLLDSLMKVIISEDSNELILE